MNRSPQAYTELLRRHRRLVWRLCWARACDDYERCRDLVQEVSLSLWEHYGGLRPNASPIQERAWVFWHTRTVLNHLLRRPSPTLVPLPAEVPEPQDDSAERVDDLIASLSEEDQRLVRMRLEGYEAEEIGQALGIKRNAVYQRLHRIVECLRNEVS